MSELNTHYDRLHDRLVRALLDNPSAEMPGLIMFSSEVEGDVLEVRDIVDRILEELDLSLDMRGPQFYKDEPSYRWVTEWRSKP